MADLSPAGMPDSLRQWEYAERKNDVKTMIQLALDNMFIRKEMQQLFSDLHIVTDDDCLALSIKLRKQTSHTDEQFLEMLELCNLRYTINEKSMNGQKMLGAIADKAFACLDYGYYENALLLAQLHDASSWLAPMGWRGNLEEHIKPLIQQKLQK